MADNPDYSAGTVSVTTGTKTVTGAGTLWASAGLLAGDTFGSDGHPRARIASINSNTSITMMDNWRGPTLAAGSSYFIRYQADGSRYAAILGEVRRMISGSANLSALSGLVGGTNKLPFFNGVGSMDQTDVTPAARAMFALAGAAGVERMPAYTDVGTVILRDVMASLNDNSLDATIVNVRGAASAALARYGGYYTGTSGVNVDNELPGSVGLYNNALVGTPTMAGVGNWWITTQRIFTNDASYQRAVGYSSTRLYIYGRTRQTGGAWSAWLPETPERGTNANGDYVKFADGTLICWSPSLAMGAVSTQTGSFYRTDRYTWTFPVAAIAGTAVVNANDAASSDLWSGCNANAAGTAAIINLNYYQALATARTARATMHGRWY